MTYPTILTFLDDDARADVRNQQAARFAQRLGSHVDGLSCHRPVTTGAGLAVAMGGFVDPLTVELEAAQREAVAREQRFRRLCDQLELASFQTEVDEIEDADRAILKRAGLHDLVILGQPDPSEDGASRRRGFLRSRLSGACPTRTAAGHQRHQQPAIAACGRRVESAR